MKRKFKLFIAMLVAIIIVMNIPGNYCFAEDETIDYVTIPSAPITEKNSTNTPD